jgi:hypothetical protein
MDMNWFLDGRKGRLWLLGRFSRRGWQWVYHGGCEGVEMLGMRVKDNLLLEIKLCMEGSLFSRRFHCGVICCYVAVTVGLSVVVGIIHVLSYSLLATEFLVTDIAFDIRLPMPCVVHVLIRRVLGTKFSRTSLALELWRLVPSVVHWFADSWAWKVRSHVSHSNWASQCL